MSRDAQLNFARYRLRTDTVEPKEMAMLTHKLEANFDFFESIFPGHHQSEDFVAMVSTDADNAYTNGYGILRLIDPRFEKGAMDILVKGMFEPVLMWDVSGDEGCCRYPCTCAYMPLAYRLGYLSEGGRPEKGMKSKREALDAAHAFALLLWTMGENVRLHGPSSRLAATP